MSDEGGGRERRQSPRFDASLDCEITLPEEERSSGLLFPGASLRGRTRDVSLTGLGLVVPSIYIGYDCVIDQGRTLVVVLLTTPVGDIRMLATAVHYVRRDAGREDEDEARYLLGLRIIEMSDEARAVYERLLAALSGE
jgi:c-di-GMP-binding flagellar brake protein YcgR